MTYNDAGRKPVNEQRLTEQLKKTGNLMDLTFEPEWLEEAAEKDGPVEAGITARPYSDYLKSLTQEQNSSLRLQAQLLSILLPELKQWIGDWGLGLSLKPVHLAARQILFQRLRQLTEDQADWISALIKEDTRGLPVAERSVRSQTSHILAHLFTAEDWRKLAEVAAEGMSQTVLQIPQVALDKILATA